MKSMRTTAEALRYLERTFKPQNFTAPTQSYYMNWLSELTDELTKQSNKVYTILETLIKATEVHTLAKGRSYFAVRTTGTRLMHEGLDVFDMGDSYTHALAIDSKHHPVVLTYSGSGETKVVVTGTNIAHGKGVPIIGVSSNINSALVEIAGEENIIITKGKRIFPKETYVAREGKEPINFLQSKSEIKALLTGELIVNELAKAKGISEEFMRKRHNENE